MTLYARRLKSSANWKDKKCYLCGNYFKADDEIALIIPTPEIREKYKNSVQNMVIHYNEFEQLSNSCTEEQLLEKLTTHKVPRIRKQLNDAQKNKLEAFRKACDSYNFTIETDAFKSETLIKRRLSKTSLAVTYNPLTEKLTIRSKGKLNIFDELYKQEILAKIFNKMHSYLGDGLVDNFSASAIVQNAIGEANKIINK